MCLKLGDRGSLGPSAGTGESVEDVACIALGYVLIVMDSVGL